MGHNVTIAESTADAIADAVASRCDGGSIRIYDGTQPADPDTAVSTQTLLAECEMGTPAFAASDGGVATAHAITGDPDAGASGTATWFRILDSAGDPVLDGTVGVGSGFDCNVVTTAVVEGAPFAIDSLTITAG